MAKEILIPQGTYTVGVDFPEGTYVFDSEKNDGTFDLFKNDKEQSNPYFNLDSDHGYKCRIELKNGDRFVLDVQVKVTKAEMISFE
ncbi:MAG: hypothetical protein J6J27_02860 [Alphaproteobacteria bacterium]|nr:hypothetical protein [Alphaproteobacteria bacterium]